MSGRDQTAAGTQTAAAAAAGTQGREILEKEGGYNPRMAAIIDKYGEENVRCKKNWCKKIATSYELSAAPGYLPGECIDFSCGRPRCRGSQWSYCVTCDERFGQNNKGHPTCDKHNKRKKLKAGHTAPAPEDTEMDTGPEPSQDTGPDPGQDTLGRASGGSSFTAADFGTVASDFELMSLFAADDATLTDCMEVREEAERKAI